VENVMSIEERVVERFLNKLRSDDAVPGEVVVYLQELIKEGKLNDTQAILRAIREGVTAHAKNAAP